MSNEGTQEEVQVEAPAQEAVAPTTENAPTTGAVAAEVALTSRELSFGEKAVGLTFNPSNDPTVQKVKELYAQIIDICNEYREQVKGLPGEQGRLFSIAITEAQTAQMWSVKALTWKN